MRMKRMTEAACGVGYDSASSAARRADGGDLRVRRGVAGGLAALSTSVLPLELFQDNVEEEYAASGWLARGFRRAASGALTGVSAGPFAPAILR